MTARRVAEDYAEMYPSMAKAAREAGFSELADLFERLAKEAAKDAIRAAKGEE